MKTYWWDEIAMEVVEVTNPDQLDGDGWEPTGRQYGAATEWATDRHVGYLINAYSIDEAEASLQLFFASTEPWQGE